MAGQRKRKMHDTSRYTFCTKTMDKWDMRMKRLAWHSPPDLQVAKIDISIKCNLPLQGLRLSTRTLFHPISYIQILGPHYSILPCHLPHENSLEFLRRVHGKKDSKPCIKIKINIDNRSASQRLADQPPRNHPKKMVTQSINQSINQSTNESSNNQKQLNQIKTESINPKPFLSQHHLLTFPSFPTNFGPPNLMEKSPSTHNLSVHHLWAEPT